MRPRLLLSVAAAVLLIAAVRPAAANPIGRSSDRESASHGGDMALEGRSGNHWVSAFDGPGNAGVWTDDRGDRGAEGCRSKGHDGPSCSNDGDDGDWGHEWAWNGGGHDGWHFGDGEWHHRKDDCNPVPEPGTMLLLALGLTGLARASQR